jgi:hypothetical protein
MRASTGASKRERIRAAVPWWAKGALKLGLSRLPVGYARRRSLSLSRHGGMERPDYALRIFREHLDAAASFHRNDGGRFTLLEMGPGDSLFTAVIAAVHGARTTWLIDVDRFANTDVAIYRTLATYLADRGLHVPDAVVTADTIDKVLAACGAMYLTGGLKSLRGLPDGSVDFIFSNSVLQAVRRDEFLDTLKELRRVMHPQGCGVHSIDLRDMMSFSLHHLRFSQRVWESDFVRRSGFYTNRLRLAEIVRACGDAGMDAEVCEVKRWEAMPIDRTKLAPPYRQMSDDELLAATIRIVTRPTARATATKRDVEGAMA